MNLLVFEPPLRSRAQSPSFPCYSSTCTPTAAAGPAPLQQLWRKHHPHPTHAAPLRDKKQPKTRGPHTRVRSALLASLATRPHRPPTAGPTIEHVILQRTRVQPVVRARHMSVHMHTYIVLYGKEEQKGRGKKAKGSPSGGGNVFPQPTCYPREPPQSLDVPQESLGRQTRERDRPLASTNR